MAAFINDYEENFAVQRKLKVYKPILDPLAELTEIELYQRYRFDRETIGYITDLIRDRITSTTQRSRAIPPEIQVCAALRFYASGSFQQVIGDTLNISQRSVCKAIWNVTDGLVSVADQFIKFPEGAEIERQKRKFYDIAHFPNVTGCIDCTHIRIQQPPANENPLSFFNRKRYYSINCQAVCDSDGKFTNIVARWPGSCHDSFILRQSALWEEFESNQRTNQHILGDAGYPCRTWLLTPYIRPNSPAQNGYNRSHIPTRSLIEQIFGRAKRRFAVLHQEIRVHPSRACLLFTACAVLHNIATERNLEDFDEQFEDEQPDEEAAEIQVDGQRTGLAYRNLIADRFFAV